MSNRQRPTGIPELTKGETFDRMHDGAMVIDPDECALALFVTMDGQLHAKTRMSPEDVLDVLEQITASARLRVQAQK